MGTEINKLNGTISALAGRIGRPLRLMEVCGTHTVAIFRHGLRSLLPENIKLLSGPGCPVCVTPETDVDAAIALSLMPDTVLVTFGDMMRVPGSNRLPQVKAAVETGPSHHSRASGPPRQNQSSPDSETVRAQSRPPHDVAPCSLITAKAEGADVRVVYSPLDALKIAKEETGKNVVFFATGFETTSPLVAATLFEAERQGVENFYIYSAHKLVPPALRALLESPEVNIDGFILPGHVSAIIGSLPYKFIPSEFGIPSVITGFGAEDILEGILMLLGQIESGRPEVEIQYKKVVRKEGNPKALDMIGEYFTPVDADWRGIGIIPGSGLELRERYRHRGIPTPAPLQEPAPAPSQEGNPPLHPSEEGTFQKKSVPPCRCGEVLRGIIIPPECPLFGKRCTPESPVGACMVSSEGSCAAYYKYNF